MNVLIVEDENAAAQSLRRLLTELRPAYRVLDHLEGVLDTVEWLEGNPAPDLIFMDIHLADGSSFEIFRRTNVISPVIFTTAYDEHALEAFSTNGIDYLLKPLTRTALARALSKLDGLRQGPAAVPAAPTGAEASSSTTAPPDNFAQLLRTMQQLSGTAPPLSWLVPHKTKLLPIAAADVAYFAIRHGQVFLTTQAGDEYAFDHSLDELESQLDPQQFFRANRQVLLARSCVAELEPYYNGRMLLHLRPTPREDVIVSKPRVTALKNWVSAGG